MEGRGRAWQRMAAQWKGMAAQWKRNGTGEIRGRSCEIVHLDASHVALITDPWKVSERVRSEALGGSAVDVG